MGRPRPDTTGAQVYDWLHQHADGDGLVAASGAAIATYLQKPTRTVQGAIQRLGQRGKVVQIGVRQFVVVELAELGE